MKDTSNVSAYLSRIRRSGGHKSRRFLSSEEAREMVRVREAGRAFHAFHTQCFWHMPEDLQITKEHIPEIIHGLRKNGGHRGYLVAARLCR